MGKHRIESFAYQIVDAGYRVHKELFKERIRRYVNNY